MTKTIANHYAKLTERLSELDNSVTASVKTAQKCLKIIAENITQLKGLLSSDTFLHEKSQIYFYRDVFPAYFSWVIYYRKIIEIEGSTSVQTADACNQCVVNHLEKVNNYLDRHRFLQRYIVEGRKHLDSIMFVKSACVPVYPDTGEFRDSQYFNFYSYLVSKINAYTKLNSYLQSRASKISELSIAVDSASTRRIKKIALNSGVINGEQADIEKKLTWLEKQVNKRSSKIHLGLFESRKLRREYMQDYTALILQQIRCSH